MADDAAKASFRSAVLFRLSNGNPDVLLSRRAEQASKPEGSDETRTPESQVRKSTSAAFSPPLLAFKPVVEPLANANESQESGLTRAASVLLESDPEEEHPESPADSLPKKRPSTGPATAEQPVLKRPAANLRAKPAAKLDVSGAEGTDAEKKEKVEKNTIAEKEKTTSAEKKKGSGPVVSGEKSGCPRFPNADRSFKDKSGEWEVFEFTRATGNLKGTIWRKIVRLPSEQVYPSYNLAKKHGFDPDKVIRPEDID